ncbi:MAG: hypothetical protein K0U78_21560 [Actinomycetia bacterium]|nr:hypothetical protein [Actinomycetes bacterium]
MTTINDLLLKSPLTADDEFEIQETGAGTSLKTTLQDIDDFIRIGSAVSTSPKTWSLFHQFEHITGGFFTDAEILIATVGAGVSAVSTNGGLAFTAFRRDTDSDYSGSAEHKLTGSQAICSITELHGVPTVGIASPFEAFDAVIDYDPARDTGSPLTWSECRNMDLDTRVASGGIAWSMGAASRLRVSAGANVDVHAGFISMGFNGNTTADSEGTIGEYIGFHASQDPRIVAPITGSVTDWLCFRADMPDANMTITNDPEGFWANGSYATFEEQIPFGIMFGENKEDKIYHGRTFSGNHRLVIETNSVEFADNGAGTLTNAPGTGAEPVPVLAKLPTGSLGAGAMQWVQVQIGATIYYLPMFAKL